MASILRKLTIGGFEHLAGSFKGAEGAAERSIAGAAGKELSMMGKTGIALLSPIIIPLNAVAHGMAYGVKGYRGAFVRAPITTSLVTAAVAVPTALGVMHAGKKQAPQPAAGETLDKGGQKLQETRHVLGVLQQTEPLAAPAQRGYSSLQQAPSAVVAASVQPQGMVASGRAAEQSLGA